MIQGVREAIEAHGEGESWMHERWIEVDDYVIAATMYRDDSERF